MEIRTPTLNFDLLKLCQTRLAEGLIAGDAQPDFFPLVQKRLAQLEVLSRSPLNILVAEPEPIPFLAGVVAAWAVKANLWFGNPRWCDREWQQVLQMAQPDLIWGIHPSPVDELPALPPKPLPRSDSGLMMIPTGGSSGQLRFAVHTWETLAAAVYGFQAHFQLTQINTCCVLPVYHVSGFMQFLRSLLTGGQFLPVPFSQVESGQLLPLNPREFWISFVPTQLQRLFNQGHHDWLSQFQGVLLGGAPAWPSLLTAARLAQVPIALTYGMTETAAQVATLHPQDFLKGNESCGRLLPHAHIRFIETQAQNADCPTPLPAKLQIQAKSLALGYIMPSGFKPFPAAGLLTDDLGYCDSAGYLHIVGRESRKIITGGENVFPAEIEAVIQSTGLVQDICVVGLADEYWGQVVTAVYVPIAESITETQIQTVIADQLCHYKQPKVWIAVEALPRNAQGKVNVEELKVAIAQVEASRISHQNRKS